MQSLLSRSVRKTHLAEYFKENKKTVWNEYLRLLNPEFYPVDLSTKCWENRNNILRKVTKKQN